MLTFITVFMFLCSSVSELELLEQNPFFYSDYKCKKYKKMHFQSHYEEIQIYILKMG